MAKAKQKALKYSTSMSEADIERAIPSLKTRGKKLREDIHKVGCSILRRWHTTEDVRPAVRQLNALHDALGGAVRTNSFKDWVIAHTLMEWEDSEFKYTATKIPAEMLRAAIDKPFWEFSKEKDYEPIDWVSMLQALIKKARKDIEKCEKLEGVDSKVNAEQLAALEAMVPHE